MSTKESNLPLPFSRGVLSTTLVNHLRVSSGKIKHLGDTALIYQQLPLLVLITHLTTYWWYWHRFERARLLAPSLQPGGFNHSPTVPYSLAFLLVCCNCILFSSTCQHLNCNCLLLPFSSRTISCPHTWDSNPTYLHNRQTFYKQQTVFGSSDGI